MGSESPRQPVSLPLELNRDIWKKAWETWNGIGTECVCRRVPALEGLDSVLKTPVKMERVDQFFLSIPSQRFLTNLLSIFLLLHSKMGSEFTHSDFHVLARVLHAALEMPVAKDVSPFLVPSANENVMSTLQELVMHCMGVVVSKATVFDDPESRTGEEAKPLLAKKPHVIDIHRVLPLAMDRHNLSFYPLVISELLKLSHLSSEAPTFLRKRKGIPPSSLPFMFVNYVPFGLGAQALATQMYRSCVVGGVSLPDTVPEHFLKVTFWP